MKLIKLDRRHQTCRDYGHTWCFRFPHWNDDAIRVEKLMTQVLGDQYDWKTYESRYKIWRAQFGRKVRGETRRPYVISFADVSVISFIMLKMELVNDEGHK